MITLKQDWFSYFYKYNHWLKYWLKLSIVTIFILWRKTDMHRQIWIIIFFARGSVTHNLCWLSATISMSIILQYIATAMHDELLHK